MLAARDILDQTHIVDATVKITVAVDMFRRRGRRRQPVNFDRAERRRRRIDAASLFATG